MKYPDNLNIGDTIGICAPSGGITETRKLEKLEAAIKQLTQMGYLVRETESVRQEKKGRSATGEQRAKELMQLLEDEKVKLIIFATGGDFLVEILAYLDWDKIRTLKPKWLQGYSDITGLNFVFTTMLEIPTMYCQTIKDYAMKPLERNLTDALKIESGQKVIQTSFPLYEKLGAEELPNGIYHLTEKVEWRNITGEEKIEITGRTLGGCLDCIQHLIGTKYDKVKDYIQTYKKDGIIWFLECFEMSSAKLFMSLWQMKQAGYFQFCRGIIFGRPLFFHKDYEIGFGEMVNDILGDLEIPIICDADIGHVSPQLAIVNGAILKITSEKGKGKVETFLK